MAAGMPDTSGGIGTFRLPQSGRDPTTNNTMRTTTTTAAIATKTSFLVGFTSVRFALDRHAAYALVADPCHDIR